MKETDDLQQIQQIERDILRVFANICRKHDLRWFLTEGSLLGAVRHGGMIPWDDDIDVALFREDYEKFLRAVRDELPEGYSCRNYRWDNDYIECMTKLEDTRHMIRSSAKGKTFETNVWIDIFVIDGMPSGKLAGKIHRFRLLAGKLRVMWSNIDHYVTARKRSKYEEFLIKLAKILRTDKLINTHKALHSLEKVMASVKVRPEGRTVNFISEYRFKTECETSSYGKGLETDFDGIAAVIPEKYDRILRKEYGDYNILPPESERYKHRLELIC